MSRLVFMLLLIANVSIGAHIYLTHSAPATALPPEINADQVKIVAATEAGKAQASAQAIKQVVDGLAGAECVELAVKAADVARAQGAFAAMSLGDRLSSRNVEEFTRFAVATPIQRDRRAADALIAALKKANIKDVSLMPDNSVSLGVFSSEDAAKRTLAELEGKVAALIKGTTITSKNPQAKETVFTVRGADSALMTRIALMQSEFAGSALRGAVCAPAPTTAAVSTNAAPTKR